MPTLITEAEILEALATASTEPADARTLAELSIMYDVPKAQLNKALRVLAHEGRLLSHRVVRTAIDGRQARVPAYTIVPKG